MSTRFRTSKFRHVAGTARKAELCYPDLRPCASTSDADLVAASTELLAVGWEGGQSVALLPLAQVGKRREAPALLHAHAGQVYDLQFAPHDARLLASAADDGLVKLWRLPSHALAPGPLQCEAEVLQAHRKRATAVRWHPSAASLLASASLDSSVAVWDVTQAGAPAVHQLPLEHQAEALAWAHDGSLLALAGGRRLAVWDVRARREAQACDAHGGGRGMRLAWLGSMRRLATTGFSSRRERELFLWDSRNLSTALKRTSVDASTGALQPLYDADARLLFLAGRGDGQVRVLDMQEAAPHSYDLATFVHAAPTKGACLVPKLALDVMQLEVARLLKLTSNAVVPVSFTVPRKSKRTFAQDLFPDTAGPEAALTAAQWFAGTDAPPRTVSLDPERVAAAQEAGGFEAAERIAAEEAARKAQAEAEAAAQAEEAAQVELPKLNIVRSSKYRHVAGKFSNKSKFWTNVRADNSFSTETEVIKCSARYFAVPWTGANGQVGVFALDRPCRLPPAPGLIECGSAQLDLDWSPFHDDLLATGLDDATVKLWRVPEGLAERASNLTEADAVLRGHRSKVSITKFHPCADRLLATASYDLAVKLWDVEAQRDACQLQCHPAAVLSLCFDWEGGRMASSCKDRRLRILDPRAAAVVAEAEGHAGAKPARVTWLGRADRLLSVGFGRNSERQFSVWDVRAFVEPLATVAIDNLSGVVNPIFDEANNVVYMAGKGDGTVSYYEITDEAPYAHFLSKFVTAEPQMGLGVLPTRTNDVRKVELLRCLKLTTKEVQPLTFTVPRTRTEFFQDDLFPPARAPTPALSAAAWLQGSNAPPVLQSLQPQGMTALSDAPAIKRTSRYNFQEEINKASTGDTMSKEYVMNKFYAKITDNWKEDEEKKADPAADVDDDEWGDDGWDD